MRCALTPQLIAPPLRPLRRAAFPIGGGLAGGQARLSRWEWSVFLFRGSTRSDLENQNEDALNLDRGVSMSVSLCFGRDESHAPDLHATPQVMYLTSKSGAWIGVSFKYHMYGADIGSLAVEMQLTADGAWREVWRRDGEQQTANADPWLEAAMAFPMAVHAVRFTGTTGDTVKSDIAVADVALKVETVPGLSLGAWGCGVVGVEEGRGCWGGG